jgi:hypothetical protein|tara:strand:- start:399 stop:659 length:261 start_codon:yes stop_codon:yes gene_type:complete
MKIPEKVNGATVKNNLRGFIRDFEKYKKLRDKYVKEKKKLEPIELKMYQLKLKMEDRRYKFTGTCNGQFTALTGAESVKELLEEEI